MIRKLLSFFVTSLLGTAVDTAGLWLMSNYVFDGYTGQFIIAPVMSFECAVFTNFLCSYYYIWRGRINRDKSKAFLRYYLKYNASCTGGFLIKMVLLLILERVFRAVGVPSDVNILGIMIPDVVLCNLMALCISGLFNFSMGEWVVFRKKKGLSGTPGHSSDAPGK